MARSPLFDIYDPYGTTGAERIEDLLPEEEKTGLLRQLANIGSSGLSGAGYILDTPVLSSADCWQVSHCPCLAAAKTASRGVSCCGSMA